MLLVALALLLGAGGAQAQATAAPEPASAATAVTGGLPETPDDYDVDAAAALSAADSDPKIQDRRSELGPDDRITASVSAEAVKVWEVGYFLNGKKVNLVVVDGHTGDVTESWTGSAVTWPMARGHEGQFGHLLNSPWIWGPLAGIFLLGLMDFRRLRKWVHLDLAVLLSFGISQAFFNAAEIGVSVPLYYPPLVYLLLRMLWIGFRGEGRGGGAGEGLRPSAPRWLLIGLVIGLVAVRLAGNIADSGVIDVGYAGVIGADRITDAEPIYGADAFPENNRTGDTYGPANYFAYVPFEEALPWSGAWDDLPAAHAAAITFDLLTILGLYALGRAVTRRREERGGDGAAAEGEAGPMGAEGEAGPMGAEGEAGPMGAEGEAGPMGAEGEAGPMGAEGEAGPMAAEGEAGPMGAEGEAGPMHVPSAPAGPGYHRDITGDSAASANLAASANPAANPAASADPAIADPTSADPADPGYLGDSHGMDGAEEHASPSRAAAAERPITRRARARAALRANAHALSPSRPGNGLGLILVFAWVAYPYTAFALQSNSNDALISALLVWSLVAFATPLARGALLATAGLAKFAPLALVPLYAAGERGIRLRAPEGSSSRLATLRPIALFAAAFLVASALLIAHPAVDPGLAAFYDRTIKSQVDRVSPFSIWGQADLEWLHTLAKVFAISLAILVAFAPRRRSPAQVAALGAAVIIAIQITLEHWFYLYIPWFLPMLLLAIAVSATAQRRLPEPEPVGGIGSSG